MMNINKLIPLFFISFIFSQFVNIQVSVEYNELDSDYHLKKYIVEDLESDIKDYFLLNKFCYEYDFITDYLLTYIAPHSPLFGTLQNLNDNCMHACMLL